MNAQERKNCDVSYAFSKVVACAATVPLGLFLAGNGAEGNYVLGFIGVGVFIGGTALTFHSIKELADTQADSASPPPQPKAPS